MPKQSEIGIIETDILSYRYEDGRYVDVIGVYEDENGIPVFPADGEIYLDGAGNAQQAVPVVYVDGPTYLDITGKLQAALPVFTSAPWVPPGAVLALDFVNDRYFAAASFGLDFVSDLYWSQAMTTYSSFAAFAAGGHAEFTRESDAWWRDGTGVPEFAAGVLRRINGIGALLLPSRTRLTAAPLGIGAAPWTSIGLPVVTVLPADGDFPAPCRVESDGTVFARRESPGMSLTSGATCRVKSRYRAGTSPNFGLYMRNVVGGTQSIVEGAVGALTSSATAAGSWSNIVNTDLGDGLYEVSTDFTPNATSADYRLGVTPRSTTSGQYVDVLGAMVVAGAGSTEWIFGSTSAGVTVAADELTLTPPGPGAFDWTITYDNDSTQTVSSHTGPLTINPTRPTIKQIIAEAA